MAHCEKYIEIIWKLEASGKTRKAVWAELQIFLENEKVT
jgi:hypothetical protein